MFLSRVEIDTRNRYKMRDLTHLGAYHHWVEESFHHGAPTDKRVRHLWRIDTINQHNYLLVISPEKPILKRLEAYGIPDSAQSLDYDHFLNTLKAGQIHRFRLTANPSYYHDGRCFPHITAKQQLKWLLDRDQKHGFKITKNRAGWSQVKLTHRAFHTLVHHGKIIKLNEASFEGQLQITDEKLFKQTLVKGLGREKAYGMGLLTVMP